MNYPTYKLSEVADILDSFRKPINSTERTKRIQGKTENKLYPYYGATGQVGLIDEYLTDGEYVLVGEDGAPFLEPFKNKSYIIRGKAWVNNHAHILSGKKDVLSNQYLNYFLNSFDYRNYVNGTTRLKLTQGNLTQIPIPLPPLPTQHAIVTRIETLFAELDKGVEHLCTAQQQLKTYRQAVLNHWLNNDEGKWEMVKLKDCTKKIFAGGDVPKNNFSETKTEKYRIPIYANAVKQKGLYGYTDVSRVNEPCVTIAGRGSGTGHTEIREEPFFPIVRLIVIIPSDNLNNSFLKYMVDSKTMAITGSAIPQLTVPTVEEYEFSLPPLAEQQRIVAEIESRLSQAEAAEESIGKALQQAEALRQSILKKAFNGELE